MSILGNSIAEYTVNNSIIRPTYMLTYESASELLHLNLEEELELRTLSEAASLRLQWRRGQVGHLSIVLFFFYNYENYKRLIGCIRDGVIGT